MLTTDLGACEWFVWDLRRSNLIDRAQLDQIVGEFLSKHPGAEPPALAEYLVSQGILTVFQTERLLQGKTQGFVLGPYTLTDALGSGSMGTVYKAQSKTDSNWYAVKVLPRRSMWNVRIARRKVRAFEIAQHPSVVPFTDVGTSGGMHYLAWPLIEGLPLDKLVAQQGKLPPAQAALFVLQAAEGLEVVHAQGLFHGLVKPSNLMLGPDGQIKILDFGIGSLLAESGEASIVDTMSTANSVNSGLDCASPESIMDPSNLNAIGDQYSLGCVLYFLLSGQYPFPEGTAVEKMMCHQHKQPKPLAELVSEVPAELLAIVERLMQKAPANRYGSCSELIEVLRPLAAAGAGQYRRVTASIRSASRPEAPVARPVTARTGRTPPNLPVARPAAEPARSTPPPEQPLRPTVPSRKPALPGARAAQPLRSPAPAAQPLRSAAPVAKLVPEPVEQAETYVYDDSESDAPPGQFMRTVGMILLAVLAGTVAWLLSSLIKL
jgi:serine/threonine-protein kinase